MQMNVESNGWKGRGLGPLLVVFLASLAALAFMTGSPLYGQDRGTIVLGTIEGELKKKQVPLDLGKTSKTLARLIAKAVSVHGGVRLAPPSLTRYSVYFAPLGGNQVRVEISKGSPDVPKKVFKSIEHFR